MIKEIKQEEKGETALFCQMMVQAWLGTFFWIIIMVLNCFKKKKSYRSYHGTNWVASPFALLHAAQAAKNGFMENSGVFSWGLMCF